MNWTLEDNMDDGLFFCATLTGMGVGRIFSRRGALSYFSEIFPGGAKSGEICFFPLEIEKTAAFCWNFQSPGGALPPLAPFR